MSTEAVTSLKGAGHFTLWFLVGYGVFLLARAAKSHSPRVQVCGPFLPFVLASCAAMPYLMKKAGLLSHEAALHPAFAVFLLYPFTDQARWAQALFGHFHLNLALLALAYAHLVGHYIGFIRKQRPQD